MVTVYISTSVGARDTKRGVRIRVVFGAQVPMCEEALLPPAKRRLGERQHLSAHAGPEIFTDQRKQGASPAHGYAELGQRHSRNNDIVRCRTEGGPLLEDQAMVHAQE